MAQNFRETAHLKTDLKKLHANWDNIDWSGVTRDLIVPEKELKDSSICEYDELLNKEDE